MFQRKKRETPGLDTTSTADISFMLLIFFLVTSSMDTDKGLARQLPMPEDQTEEQELVVKRRNVMELRLDAAGCLTCDGDTLSDDALISRIEDFVANAADDPQKPERSEREVHLLGRCRVSDRHVIFVDVSPEATYDAYFQMQNAVVAAYSNLRNQLSQRHFGHDYKDCTQEQRDAVAMVFPQRISERVGEGRSDE